MSIVTLGSEKAAILLKKASRIGPDELDMGLEIGHNLIEALISLKKPVAGLAANQLGVLKQVFVFSWDRTVEHLELVMNPEFEPVGHSKMEGWEACLSTISSRKVANIKRYETIRVEYTNRAGQVVKYELTGFAARVFQHEYDHLEGLLNINRQDATVQEFDTDEALLAFMAEVRSKDAIAYIPPKGL